MFKFWNILIVCLLVSFNTSVILAAAYKIDGSSKAAFDKSLNYISKDLSDEQKVKLGIALLKLKLEGVNSAAELLNNSELMNGGVTDKVIKQLDGLTYREIIALADEKSTVQLQLSSESSASPGIPRPTTSRAQKRAPVEVRPTPEYEENGLVVIDIKEPRWPHSALMNGQEGWVALSFKLDAAGQPVNVELLDSSPSKLFERAALDSISEWHFEIPDKYTTDTTYRYVMEFRLAGEEEVLSEFQGNVVQLSRSELTIDDAWIVSIDNERLAMSLDYAIEPFHQGDKMYGCVIMFKGSDGQFANIPYGSEEACFISEASGVKVISSAMPDEDELERLNGKLAFFVLVTQRAEQGVFKQIGISRIFQYQLDGFE